MAGVARALRSIGIHPTHPAVRPGYMIDGRFSFLPLCDNLSLLVTKELHDCPVTLPASVDRIGVVARHAGCSLRQNIVQACEDLSGFRVMTSCKLLVFLIVAPRTVFRSNKHSDPDTVMIPAVDIHLLRTMALKASDTALRVT